MRVLLLLGMLACLPKLAAQGMQIQSLTPIVATWDSTYGTSGIRLQVSYVYQDAQQRTKTALPIIRLYQEGRLVYKSTPQIVPLVANTRQDLELFVPYRQINLLPAPYENISLELELAGATAQTIVAFEQPRRYQVEIDLHSASIKQQLEPYDQGSNPKEWLPDGYFALTTNQGQLPLYQSNVYFNQYDYAPQKIKVNVLEGETLLWTFYDRDGEKDLNLGQYTLPTAAGDLVEDYYGQMFGQIKDLDFTYAQRTQARQAINIYSNGRYVHQEKKGVALSIKYDLARAYRGKKATAHFNFYDENGIRLEVPLLYALGETAPMEEAIALTTKGKLQYFVPFYVWKEACRSVEFYFLIEETGERIQAARHVLLEPIEFDDWVIDAQLAVQQPAIYRGAQGVRLEVSYALVEVYKNAPLYIYFSQPDGTALPFAVYYLPGDGSGVPFTKEHKTQNPKRADRLSFFVPYSSLNGQSIGVRAELVPDVAMHIFEDFTEPFERPEGKQDVELVLAKASERFRADNYGQVLDLAVRVPPFYQRQSELQLEILENGVASTNFKLDGARLKQPPYTLEDDSARIYIVLPHRRIRPGTTFEVRACAINAKNRQPMSEPIEWSWTAPKQLFNNDIEIVLEQCKFDHKVLKDTSLRNNFPWEYVVEAGGDVLFKQPLEQKWINKSKDAYTQTVRVNREDNITIKLQHRETGQQIIVWKGDLSKWEQSNFQSALENRYPVKWIKVSAKVPKDYDQNQSNTTSSSGRL